MDSLISRRLARRVRGLVTPGPVEYDPDPVTAPLREYLRDHLARGETHYTTRPGLVELRRAIGERLGTLGAPARTEAGVLVTASEGESLFVTLLGLGATPGSTVRTADTGWHRTLFDLMEIDLVAPTDARAADSLAAFWRVESAAAPPPDSSMVTVAALGSRLVEDGPVHGIADDMIVIGDLTGYPGLDHFQTGFVAGPPDRLAGIMTWKQALSICTAAPSQRVALGTMCGGGR